MISELESNKVTLQDYLDFLKEDKMFTDSLRMQIGLNEPTLSIYQMNNWIGKIVQTTRCEIYTDILKDLHKRTTTEMKNKLEGKGLT